MMDDLALLELASSASIERCADQGFDPTVLEEPEAESWEACRKAVVSTVTCVDREIGRARRFLRTLSVFAVEFHPDKSNAIGEALQHLELCTPQIEAALAAVGGGQ